MPTFKFEAMDTSGGEVKDSVEAMSEEEAQQKIRQMGYFVTKITEVAGAKKGKKKAARRRKKGATFTIGGVSSKALCTFTRQFSTLQDAGLPVLRSLRILEGQRKPGVLKNALIVVVVLVAVSILTFIMLYIIPKFEKIFKDFNMELPEMTRALMAVSKWFSLY